MTQHAPTDLIINHPQSVHDVIACYDVAGELAMLAYLTSAPYPAAENQRWISQGLITLPDGSGVLHQHGHYTFTPAEPSQVELSRPAVMGDRRRPQLTAIDHIPQIWVHIAPNTPIRTNAWPELQALCDSTNLIVEIHGQTTPEHAAALAADGDATSLIGIQIESYEGRDVIDCHLAYEHIEEFAEAVNQTGLGQLYPKLAQQLTPVQWSALVASCAAMLDFDLKFCHDVVNENWFTVNAIQVMQFLTHRDPSD